MSEEYTFTCVHHSLGDVVLLYIDIGKCYLDRCNELAMLESARLDCCQQHWPCCIVSASHMLHVWTDKYQVAVSSARIATAIVSLWIMVSLLSLLKISEME